MVRYMADSVDCRAFHPTVSVPGGGGTQPISLTAGYLPPSSYSASSQACGGTNVKIDVAAVRPDADVLDIETGDATPASAPGWVKAHNALNTGYPAVLYCNRSTITAVANALAAAGLVVNTDYKWWIATLDGTKTVPDMTGVTAVQVWSANYFPDNIDLSIVYDDNWKKAVVPPSITTLPGTWNAIISLVPSGAVWLLTGLGTDNNLWQVVYDPATKTWNVPYILATVKWGPNKP